MSVILWLLAGSIAAWITCSVLNLNAASFVSVATIVGPVGVIFGGDALPPPTGRNGSAVVFSPFSVLIACAGAIAFLYIVRAIYQTWRSRLTRRSAEYKSA